MPDHPAPATMSRGMVALFAVGCGVSVANLYYAQPLLPSIGRDLHVGASTAALVVTGAQVGYGAGLAFIVPLGDLVVRRRLVPTVLVAAALALVAAAAAPDAPVLIAASALAGVFSVAAQVLVPFAAHLAAPEARGRVVGTVMSGLLLGILLARTVSGLIAQVAGWRTVYVVAAGVVGALAWILARRLPGEHGQRSALRYRQLLASVVHLMRTEPVLRLRSALGALVFAAFNVLWTSLAFLLAGPPYHYSRAAIGAFGLLGAGGALVAAFSGRLADRGLERATTGGALVLIVGAFGLLALGRSDLAPLVVGIVAVDLGIQAVHVQNQGLIYALQPEARSRINTGYMVSYFIGGSIGSATTGLAYAAGGWDGVVLLGAGYAAVALVLWAASEIAARPAGSPRRGRAARL